MAQRPIAVGLSLCEQVVIEEKTRNVTLVNCFTERVAEEFPADNLPFVAFALLTDGNGEMPLAVVIERLDTFEEIHRISVTVRFPNPLQTMRCTIRVRTCPFPVPGHYQVSLVADGETIAQRKMEIVAKENNP
jgi:hypothetical protein